MSTRITLLGDGAMATVIAMLLESNGNDVTVWGPFAEHIDEMRQTRANDKYLPGVTLPEGLRLVSDEADAMMGAQVIVNAIPTQFVRRVWERFVGMVPTGVPIASVAKGIENETLLRPTQIIADVIDEAEDEARSYASLSGPSIAKELAAFQPATLCAASEDLAFAEQLQELCTSHWMRVYTNPDLLGVELAGATKNVIAIAAGICDGLQAGYNAKSALLARGLAEITRLGSAMGANTETFFGVTGVGDLATTCFCPEGRNRTLGEHLGKGKTLDEAQAAINGIVEGVATTRSVVALAERHVIEMPITAGIYDVLFEGLNPTDGITRLMSREPKQERVG